MNKVAIVVLADIAVRGDLGRVTNALEVAREFKEAGDEVAIVFDGAGVRWINELENPNHRKHELWFSVKDKAAGACSFCAKAHQVAFGVKDAGLKLLDEFEGHPSLRTYVVEGYQVITF